MTHVQGVLTKHSLGRSIFKITTWKDRLFTLDPSNGKITYSKERETAAGNIRELRGTLMVKPCTTVEEVPESKFSRNFAFALINLEMESNEPIPVMYLQASDNPSRTRWIQAFQKTIRNLSYRTGKKMLMLTPSTDKLLNNSSLAADTAGPRSPRPLTDLKIHETMSPEKNELAKRLLISISSDQSSASPLTCKNQTTKRLKKRALILREILRSQKSYLENLSMCRVSYYDALKKLAAERECVTTLDSLKQLLSGKWEDSLTDDDVSTIFGNFTALLVVDHQFLAQMNQAVPPMHVLKTLDEERLTDICAALGHKISYMAPFLAIYVQYASNFCTASKALERVTRIRSVKACLDEQHSSATVLALQNYLVLPLQHLIMLRMLLGKLLGHTDQKHADLASVLMSLHYISLVTAKMEESSKAGSGQETTQSAHTGLRNVMCSFASSASFHGAPESPKPETHTDVREDEGAPPRPPAPPMPGRRSPSMMAAASGSTHHHTPPPTQSMDHPPALPPDHAAAGSESAPASDAPQDPVLPLYQWPAPIPAPLLSKAMHPDARTLLEALLPNRLTARLEGTAELGGNQGHVDTLGDGTKVYRLRTGNAEFKRESRKTSVVLNADGTCFATAPDGSSIQHMADGTTVQDCSDGAKNQWSADGSSIHVLADGTSMQNEASGEQIFKAADGTKTHRKADGTLSEKRADGRIMTCFPNGLVKMAHTNGLWVQMDPDGTKIELLADKKTQRTTTPDGIQIFVMADGSQRTIFTDGKTVVRAKDGTKTTIWPNGTKKVTSPDGSVVMTGTDGRERRWKK